MRTIFAVMLALAVAAPAIAQEQAQAPAQATAQAGVQATAQGASDLIVGRIVARETEEMAVIRKYQPLVETYIQQAKSDPNEGWVPNGDHYFLGRADFGGRKGVMTASIVSPDSGKMHWTADEFNNIFGLSTEFLPQGFLQMVFVDSAGLNTHDYHFDYVRREFLGEVRTLVFDVTPTGKNRKGKFVGRIWADDVSFTIVRFNGTYSAGSKLTNSFDFDSWRLNAGPNLWLPTYIYSEVRGATFPMGSGGLFKAQTRLWGYNVGRSRQEEELSKVMVESNAPIQDETKLEHDLSPIQETRSWNQQASQNVMDNFQRKGLIAPPGDVDQVLRTVTNNLEVTNNLNLDPEVDCRVLMTSTIESFSIGHTIVLSRGLIDVLPDEASLAAMVAKELAYIVMDRPFDTQWAFMDRLLLQDEKHTFQHFDFGRTPADEEASSKKAAELLANSPYKDQLKTVRMFVAELQQRSKEIPNLISPRLGDKALAMVPVTADVEDKPAANEIVALPLGGRVKFDPWNDSLQLLKSEPPRGISEREKMPFEVTPFMPYLTRESEKEAATSQGAE